MLAEVLLKLAALEAAEREVAYRPRPSCAGPEECPRKFVYFARGVPREPLMDRMAMVLDDSSVHEDLTAKWIEQSGFTLHDRQLRVEIATLTHQGRPFVLAGSIDGLLTDLMGRTWLWEHKALSHWSWERYARGEQWPLNYLTQCALYLTGLRKAGWSVSEAVLVMKNKNTSDYLEFRLTYDPDADELRGVERIIASTGERVFFRDGEAVWRRVRAEAIARFDAIEAHWAAGTLPNRPYPEPQSFPCGYCPYRQRCWQDWQPQPLDGRITLTPEDAVLAAEYLALSEELRPKYRRKEELGEQLKLLLKANGAREAVADNVLVRLERRVQSRVDLDLIPAELREAATRSVEQDYLKASSLRKGGC